MTLAAVKMNEINYIALRSIGGHSGYHDRFSGKMSVFDSLNDWNQSGPIVSSFTGVELSGSSASGILGDSVTLGWCMDSLRQLPSREIAEEA